MIIVGLGFLGYSRSKVGLRPKDELCIKGLLFESMHDNPNSPLHKFKLLKGRNGGFCDRLTSSSYNASNARNSSYKIELELSGRNGNLSIGIYYPSSRQYQEKVSNTNISVYWRQIEEYFEPAYEIFQLVLHACVKNNVSYIGLDNIDLLQLSKDGNYTKSCSVQQFSCGDNSCISIDQICDFRHNCLNGQDESNVTCGSLPIGAYCNFDSPDWCGWHNVQSGDLIKDDLDWKWHTGSTPTQDTGPTEDHTTGNGHYVYMHSSDGKLLELAVLESPIFDAPNENPGQTCQVRIHYYMFGRYVSHLVLKLVPLNDDDLQPCEEKNRVILFDKWKDQGPKWLFAAVDIKNVTKRFKLHFIGKTGFNKQSDIALDDVSLSPSCFGKSADLALDDVSLSPSCFGKSADLALDDVSLSPSCFGKSADLALDDVSLSPSCFALHVLVSQDDLALDDVSLSPSCFGKSADLALDDVSLSPSCFGKSDDLALDDVSLSPSCFGKSDDLALDDVSLDDVLALHVLSDDLALDDVSLSPSCFGKSDDLALDDVSLSPSCFGKSADLALDDVSLSPSCFADLALDDVSLSPSCFGKSADLALDDVSLSPSCFGKSADLALDDVSLSPSCFADLALDDVSLSPSCFGKSADLALDDVSLLVLVHVLDGKSADLALDDVSLSPSCFGKSADLALDDVSLSPSCFGKSADLALDDVSG
ncbi:ALK [Mytilus coruscus]|uniref:ALK n=1 Tax=Mytilus coruscus TaxID=42192 RepID=A0A6J8D9T2_MYTCO|nr:ALK [Mytilus coruscus]